MKEISHLIANFVTTIKFLLCAGCWVVCCKMFVNIFIILRSPTKKLSANRNNNYHFSNLFINSVPIHRRTIYHSSTKIFLSFYNKEENIINYEGKQKLLGSAFQLMHISISKLHTTTQLQHQLLLPHNTEIITRMIV